jgi:protein arginine kinase
MSLAVRGLFGEGAQPLGDFFQISNQVALGVSEDDILERLNKLVPQFVSYERNLRKSLLEEDRAALEDKVWRAYGILRSARTITSEDALEQLSALRLGVNLELLPKTIDLDVVNDLFLATQPAHLQKHTTGIVGPKERDIARATLLRSRLGAFDGAG